MFLTRIKALLRRGKINSASEALDSNEIGGITIDRERYLIIHNGKETTLPKKEFELLHLLTSKPGKVFTREEILDKVWGGEVVVGDRTIDVHIRKLREKIGESYFRTVKGVGYTFEF